MDVLLAALDISYSSSTRLFFQFTLLQLSARLVCVRVWRAVRVSVRTRSGFGVVLPVAM